MAISVDIEKKLHGFTLKVKLESDGSPMGILGASGSGKSMTSKCIMRLLNPRLFDLRRNPDTGLRKNCCK